MLLLHHLWTEASAFALLRVSPCYILRFYIVLCEFALYGISPSKGDGILHHIGGNRAMGLRWNN